tara:strand:+ start:165 stop:686 length:522 start_codon:yes stop_codon:yes gene_type:complete
MFDTLYSYIFSPRKTVQIKSHTKDWKLWWAIIGITSLISVIQVSKIGLFSIAIHAGAYLVWVLIFSMIFDAVAQLIGARSRLRTLIYWFGFTNTLFWISPSIIMIQDVFSSIGALAMVILNGLFLYYLWITLKYIYNFSNVKVLNLFCIPIISAIIATFCIVVYGSHWMALLL